MNLTIAEDRWAECGPREDPGSHLILEGGATINGVGFHLEGWAVTVTDDGIQTADTDDEGLACVHRGVGAEGHWQTVEIRGREYVLVMSPYC